MHQKSILPKNETKNVIRKMSLGFKGNNQSLRLFLFFIRFLVEDPKIKPISQNRFCFSNM